MITNNKMVTFDYEVKDENGDLVDNSNISGPIMYIHGTNTILNMLESTLAGLDAGKEFKVEIPPKDAYGFRNEDLVKVFDRAAFNEAGELQVGMVFNIDGSEDDMKVKITKIEGENITVDANHPLAGRTLKFTGQVTDVRDATAEELASIKQ